MKTKKNNKSSKPSKPSIAELKLCTGGILGNNSATADSAPADNGGVVGTAPVL